MACYKDRADSENRIKELKCDFGLDRFCMDKFWAKEATFRTIMIAYNLIVCIANSASEKVPIHFTHLKVLMLCMRKLDNKTCWKNNTQPIYSR